MDQPCCQSFPIAWVKTESELVTSVQTDIGRSMLAVAVINVDAYPFLAFSYLTFHLEVT